MSTIWDDLPAAEQAEQWERIAPGLVKRILDNVDRREANRLKIERAETRLRLIGMCLGFACVLSLIVAAWHFVDRGYPYQATVLLGASGLALVSVFVTGTVLNHPGARSRRVAAKVRAGALPNTQRSGAEMADKTEA